MSLERQQIWRRRSPAGCFGPLIANASPFVPMAQLAGRMERMIESFRSCQAWGPSDPGAPAPPRSEVENSEQRAPDVELRWSVEAVHISVSLPGVRHEDVRIEAGEGAIAISGERDSFHRVIPLPNTADVAAARARMRASILEITMPLLQSRPHKRIEVELY